MLSTPQHLQQRVIADPEDVEARLVLADLLSQAGDPQGEYIQLAIRLEALDATDPLHAELRCRVAQLELRGVRDWTQALYAGLMSTRPAYNLFSDHGPRTPFAMRRGFAEELSGRADHAIEGLALACESAPIRALTVFGSSKRPVGRSPFLRLAEHERLPQLRHLDLCVYHPEDELALVELVRSPRLQRLDAFHLSASITPELLDALLHCPALASLRSLRIQQPASYKSPRTIGTWGLRQLAATGYLSQLRAVDLEGQQVGSDGCGVLGSLSTLEEVTIRADMIGPEGAARLTRLSGLRKLTLEKTGIGNSGATALFSSPELLNLHTLHLDKENNLTADWAMSLASVDPPALRSLTLYDAPLGPAGVRALATRTLPKLESLTLEGSTLTAADALLLASAAECEHLTSLKFNTTDPLLDDAVAPLAHGPLLARVRELETYTFTPSASGVRAFASWPGLAELRRLATLSTFESLLHETPNLEHLTLQRSFEGVGIVARADLPRLRELEVYYNYDFDGTELLPQSPAGQTLERLLLGGIVTDSCASAICALPSLRQFYSFMCGASQSSAALLYRHFGSRFEGEFTTADRWRGMKQRSPTP